MKSVAAQIKERRTELGWSQKELAEKLGTRQSRISQIEDENYDMTIRSLREVAKVLGMGCQINLIPNPRYMNLMRGGRL